MFTIHLFQKFRHSNLHLDFNNTKMRLFILFQLIFFFIYSCQNSISESELIGNYTPINYEKCFDTISIAGNNTYYRVIYDNKKQLIYKTKGKWFFKSKNKIEFNYFFLNLDRDLNKYPELLNDTMGSFQVLIDLKENSPILCFGYFDGENCYFKI
jgi:hypothetical protein